jgi:hypothetical protein
MPAAQYSEAVGRLQGSGERDHTAAGGAGRPGHGFAGALTGSLRCASPGGKYCGTG